MKKGRGRGKKRMMNLNNLRVAVIDADLIGRKKHRFPNLACMKISGYYKELGYAVELKLNYNNLESFDKVFISKVFTDTPVPEEVLAYDNVKFGGTGFYYDKAEPLPCYIEHHMPDYDLYLDWVNNEIAKGKKRKEFEYYLDYSIGFTTRGCFRKCSFCVNRNSTKVVKHSPLSEFYDENRKYICLLDDNILGSPNWKEIFEELIATGKPFQYKQGMDERILTREKCEYLARAKYKERFIFAFDNIADAELIKTKLKLLREYTNKRCMFYVFTGFDREDVWDEAFWKQDIIDVFERIKILMTYNCLPYIMRFERYKESPHRGIYITLARWCNQPSFFLKKSFREFCELNGENSAPMRYLAEFEAKHPDIAEKYFDIKYALTGE